MSTYTIAGEITQDSVEPFKDFLNSHQGEEIEINISSPGGEVFAGLSMAEAMRNFKTTKGVISVKIGTYAASMAGVLALLADELKIGMNSFLMLHAPIVAPGYINANGLDDLKEQLLSAQATLTNYIKENFNDDRVDEWMSSDCTWFNADKMVEVFDATIVGKEQPVLLNMADLEHVAKPQDIEAKFAESELHDEPAPQDIVPDVPAPEPEPEPEPQDIVPPAPQNDADALTALESLKNQLKELGIE